MSTEIDERVVEMRFNNRQFEEGARETMNTLTKLKQHLKFEESEQGFKNIQNGIKNVDFSAMTNAINGVKNSFSALEIAAITAVSNITNRIVNMAINMGKELTVAPLTTGLSEYEEKMDNIMVTLVNSGESLGTVNGILDDLNHYADKTIYKFSDMTAALGKFTIAGIGLDEARDAIEGIGNAAAMSGLKAYQASSAYYMIAQAYQSGVMTLYQFRTLENSGFASKEFRQHIMDAAVAYGSLEKTAEGTYKTVNGGLEVTRENLRNTLDKKWLTKDVLNYVFQEYADATTDFGKEAFKAAQEVKTASQLWDTLKEAAQSGWAKNWEYIVGDYDQAKKMWTSVNEIASGILNKFYDTQAEILEFWNQNGGRAAVLEGLSNAFYGLLLVIQPVKEGLHEIFPSVDGQRLVELSKRFQEITSQFVLSEEGADKLKRTTKGLFSIFSTGIEVISQLWDKLEPIRNFISSGIGDITEVIARIGDALVFINETAKSTDIFSGFGDFAKKIKDMESFKNVWEGIYDLIGRVNERIKAIWKLTTEYFPSLDGLFDFGIDGEKITLLNVLGKTLEGILKLLAAITVGCIDIGTKGILAISNGLKSLSINDILRSLLSGQLIVAIGDFILQLAHLLDPLNDIGDVVNDIKEEFQILINATSVKMIKDVGIAIGILAASLWVLAKIDPDGLGQAIGSVIFLVTTVGVLVKTLSSSFNNGPMFKGLENVFQSLKSMQMIPLGSIALKIAGAVAILAGAMALVGQLDLKKAIQGFAAVEIALFSLVGAMALLSKIDAKGNSFTASFKGIFSEKNGIDKLSKSLVKIAVSLNLLILPIKVLGEMDFGNIIKGGLAVVALLGSLVGIMAILQNIDIQKTQIGSTIMKLAVALNALVLPIELLGNMDRNALIQGGIAIAGLMTVLTVAMIAVSKWVHIGDKTASAMVGFGLAIIELSAALKILDKIKFSSLLGSVAALSILVTEFGILTQIVDSSGLKAGGAVLAFASGILIMSTALAVFNNLDWVKTAIGTVAIAGLLAAFWGFTALTNEMDVVATAGAITIFSLAISLLAGDLILLSMAPIGSLIASVLSLVAVFAGMVFVSGVLANLSPVLVTAGGALIVFGAGCALISGSILMLAVAFSILLGAVNDFVTGLANIKLSTDELKLKGYELAAAISEGTMEGLSEQFSGEKISQKLINGLVDCLSKKSIHNMANALGDEIGRRIEEGFKSVFSKKEKRHVKVGGPGGRGTMEEAVLQSLEDLPEAAKEIGAATSEALADGLDENADDVEESSGKLKGFLTDLWNVFTGTGSLSSKASDASNLIATEGKEAIKSVKDEFVGRYGLDSILGDTTEEMEKMSEEMAKSIDISGKYSDSIDKVGGSVKQTKTYFEELTEAIKSDMNMFNKFDRTTEMTTEELLDNMSSNILGISEWSNNLAVLASRGLSQGLIETLSKEGPSMYKEVAALAKATDDQIAQANNMWSMSMTLPGYAAQKVEASYTYAGEMAAKGYSDALKNYAGIIDGYEIGKDTMESIRNALVAYQPVAATQATATGKATNKALADEISETKGVENGGNLVKGVAKGILRDERYATNAARIFASNVNNAFTNTEEIKSPSRVWADFGMYLDKGLANGIKDHAGLAVNASSSIADRINEAIQLAYYAVQASLTSDYTPTITPVLDLSKVQNGVSGIDTMFSSNNALAASASYNASIQASVDTRASQMELLRGVDTSLKNASRDIIDAIASGDKEVTINLNVTPDSYGMFKTVRAEAIKYTKSTGQSAFA